MELKIHIKDYTPEKGLYHHWEDGFSIRVTDSDSEIVIAANKEGLISLAIQLLTLAQENVPDGCHYHYDDYGGLEDGSKELVIVKDRPF